MNLVVLTGKVLWIGDEHVLQNGRQAITIGVKYVKNFGDKQYDRIIKAKAFGYHVDFIKNNITGETSKTGLPNSNVLYYGLENDAWCCVRPSGTEPKIKFYMGVKGTSLEDADKKLNELETAMREIAK